MNEEGYGFCFIGGLAFQRWGNPRYTQDVDLTVICPIGDEAEMVSKLASWFPSRMNQPLEFSVRSRIYLARLADGTPADIALGVLDFEYHAVERAVMFDFGVGDPLKICTAEDLIVFKAFAARDRDWFDVRSVVIRQNDKLNWRQIFTELEPLVEMKEQPEILATLRDIRANSR
ncbi:MAG: hypothetical protein H7232_16085 [Aeromicrobium sp.]|nr:hypothetical protein [Burkholderiales bacterium]